jgi:hypothetical protein
MRLFPRRLKYLTEVVKITKNLCDVHPRFEKKAGGRRQKAEGKNLVGIQTP